MRQDDRGRFDRALRRARESAHAPGEFVGQESFMTAGEIRALAKRAGIGPGVGVLDVCCGVGGPGRLLTRELGCEYLGVDESESAVAIARERTNGLRCRFADGRVPPLPEGTFDVVVVLETMLAFEDKEALVRAIAAALRPGGRLAFTLEEGFPLTPAERAAMPHADTVWLTPLDEMADSLERAGLVLAWREDHSTAHRSTARALTDAFSAYADEIVAQIGHEALDELLAAHRLWGEWLGEGRVRKLALVAERSATSKPPTTPTSPRSASAAPCFSRPSERWRRAPSVNSCATRLPSSRRNRLGDVDHRQGKESRPDYGAHLIFLDGGTIRDRLGDAIRHLPAPALQPRLSEFSRSSHVRSPHLLECCPHWLPGSTRPHTSDSALHRGDSATSSG